LLHVAQRISLTQLKHEQLVHCPVNTSKAQAIGIPTKALFGELLAAVVSPKKLEKPEALLQVDKRSKSCNFLVKAKKLPQSSFSSFSKRCFWKSYSSPNRA
jgi:hypothetical protein